MSGYVNSDFSYVAGGDTHSISLNTSVTQLDIILTGAREQFRVGATAVEERWLIDEQLAWVRGLQVPELLLSTHNTVPETKKAICTHAGGVYIT